MTNRSLTLAALLTVLCLFTSAAIAQGPPRPDDGAPPRPESPQLNLLEQLPGVFGEEDQGPKLFFNARFEVESGTSAGRLLVTAEPAPGWHVYSITQKPGGPLRSKLSIANSDQVKLAGPFAPDQAAKVILSDVFKSPDNPKQPLEIEEHHAAVIWAAPIELAPGVDPESLTITVKFDGQVCKESCISVTENLPAKFAGFYTLAKATGQFEADSGHVTWKGHFEPQVVQPGDTARLVLTAHPVAPYHLYAYEATSPPGIGPRPTLIAFKSLPGDWKQSSAVASTPVITKKSTTPGISDQTYHEGAVTWTVDLKVPATATPGKVDIGGAIGFQTCESDGSCDLPLGALFNATLTVGEATQPGEALLAFQPTSYTEAETIAKANAPRVERSIVVEAFTPRALLTAFGFALLGGLILNVMPCVLPVIPLKLLSFVEQAGQSRSRLMTYNLVYAAGTISVFMALAVAGIVFGLGWGEQFAVTEFQIIVTLFMFAMTLSLLGLWEIPLPGAIGSGETVSNENAGSYVGAFWKGFMTTIYATPCSGPFLGIALGATIGFPAYATLLVFFGAGLGFASPYIIFGLLMTQYPSITRVIPKPGVWMEHVKQGLGFLMLAVMVWWYFPMIDPGYHMATLFAAIGVALGCWMIGKVPPYAEARTKLLSWGGATASIALVSWLAFAYLGPMNAHEMILPWKPYSAEALADAQQQGKTVMVDFTADWCLNCKVNLTTAIDTEAVHDVVQKNNVVVLLADWSDRNEGIKRKLQELNSNSIPLLAIYPGSGGEPIILRDTVFQSTVLGALEKAGPSLTNENSAEAATAMTSRETR